MKGRAEFGVKIGSRLRVRVGVVKDSLRIALVRSCLTELVCDSSRSFRLSLHSHRLEHVSWVHDLEACKGLHFLQLPDSLSAS